MSDLQIENLQKLQNSHLLSDRETSSILGGNSNDLARLSFLQNNFDDVISGGAGKDLVFANDGRSDLVFDGDGSDVINSNLGDIAIRLS